MVIEGFLVGHGGRRPGSGRKKGALNKRSRAKADAIEASGLTPLDFMIEVMRNQSNTAEMRLEAAKSAAPYVHPRLHATEISEADDDLPDDQEITYQSHPGRQPRIKQEAGGDLETARGDDDANPCRVSHSAPAQLKSMDLTTRLVHESYVEYCG